MADKKNWVLVQRELDGFLLAPRDMSASDLTIFLETSSGWSERRLPDPARVSRLTSNAADLLHQRRLPEVADGRRGLRPRNHDARHRRRGRWPSAFLSSRAMVLSYQNIIRVGTLV